MNNAKTGFSTRNIMKILALLSLVMIFCPLFMVSCAGQTETIGLLDIIGGVEYYGEPIVNPHYELIVCILLPIAVLVILFLKKINKKKTSIAVTVLCAADFLILLIMRGGVKRFCEENGFTFRSTGWMKFDWFLHILLITGGILCAAGVLHLDGPVTELADPEERPKRGRKASDSTDGPEPEKDERIICYCSKCGKPVRHGETVCASCGEPIHPDILQKAEAEYEARIEEAEKAKAAAEEEKRQQEAAQAADTVPDGPKFCEHCGAPLPAGAKFCENCGTRVNRE